jgi:hypothetical protein
MKKMKIPTLLAVASLLCGQHPALAHDAESAEVQGWLKTLQSVQPGDEQIESHQLAAAELQSHAVDPLVVLSAMNAASPLGSNWLLGVANAIKPETLDTAKLKSFLADQTNDGEARYQVFEWLTDGNPQLRDELLDAMMSDSSPELRYMAIQRQLDNLDQTQRDAKQTVALMRQLLGDARFPTQVIDIATKLNTLIDDDNEKIVLADHFGFVRDWRVIGPFDNTDQAAFETAYEVEKDILAGDFDVAKSYDAKQGSTDWKSAKANDEAGLVDLAEAFEKEKSAVVYAYTTFESLMEMPVDIRLGCINANKVWVNGELVISNEVYHASSQIDQYVAAVKLQPGTNEIVVKVLQNDQKESWAQRFEFQLRVCDSTGKAVASK